MFGFVIADREKLTPQQLARYRGCYCGLCRTLHRRFGRFSRMTLNYDMTFLVMVLSSLYEPAETDGEERCAAHPAKAHAFWCNDATDYAADMNIALTYHKFLDDWQDDRSQLKRGGAQLLKGAYEQVRQRQPRQCQAIEDCLSQLSRLEKAQATDPDEAASCFGRLMAEVFHWKDDRWTEPLCAMAFFLGEFIYLQDACIDLHKDAKRGSYNPLLALHGAEKPLADFEPSLVMLAGQSADAFDRLPLVQDADILKNILYSGIWCRYHAARLRQEQKEKEAEPK